uniref:Immunoglobulin V-set domain-containing protein n=1 Tax=Oryzias sinensis TaxID=183150 RepID=A0A8C8DR90_9TELE
SCLPCLYLSLVSAFLLCLSISLCLSVHVFIQNGAQCYGALGGTVSLQLMDDFSKIHKYELFTKSVKVLTGRKDRTLDIKMKDTFSFLPSNGTFWIHNLSRSNGGEYRLTTFDSNGRITENRTLQLLVQGKYDFIS